MVLDDMYKRLGWTFGAAKSFSWLSQQKKDCPSRCDNGIFDLNISLELSLIYVAILSVIYPLHKAVILCGCSIRVAVVFNPQLYHVVSLHDKLIQEN